MHSIALTPHVYKTTFYKNKGGIIDTQPTCYAFSASKSKSLSVEFILDLASSKREEVRDEMYFTL